MRTKRRLTLLVTIIVLFGLILLVKYNLPSVLHSKPDQPFASVKKDSITSISLEDAHGTTTQLQKKKSQWYVEKGTMEFNADESRVNQLIDAIINFKKDDLASTNIDKQKELGIDKQTITFTSNNKQHHIYIGNVNENSKNYIRIDNENNVYLTNGFDSTFTPADYRNLAVPFVSDENKVTNVTINNNDVTVILEKKNNGWFVNDQKAQQEKVDYYLNDLKTLKASDIVNKNNFDTSLENNLSITVKENNEYKTANFYQIDNESYYAIISKAPYVYRIQSGYVEALRKTAQDFNNQ